MEAIADKKRFFSNKDLISLFVPLTIEQGLEYTVGMFCDWTVKAVLFEWHDKKKRWTRFKAI